MATSCTQNAGKTRANIPQDDFEHIFRARTFDCADILSADGDGYEKSELFEDEASDGEKSYPDTGKTLAKILRYDFEYILRAKTFDCACIMSADGGGYAVASCV